MTKLKKEVEKLKSLGLDEEDIKGEFILELGGYVDIFLTIELNKMLRENTPEQIVFLTVRGNFSPSCDYHIIDNGKLISLHPNDAFELVEAYAERLEEGTLREFVENVRENLY